jgi:hypothetical protein
MLSLPMSDEDFDSLVSASAVFRIRASTALTGQRIKAFLLVFAVTPSQIAYENRGSLNRGG